MKISAPKLKVFKTEADLRGYLDQSGILGDDMEEHVKEWKNLTNSKPTPMTKKTTMVVTETDDSVEIK